HERDRELRFAALQSAEARELLESVLGAEGARDFAAGLSTAAGDPTSVLLVEDGRVLSHSTAALGIARHLRWPWRFVRVTAIVPRFIRDAFYRWFARHRYAWFGKSDACRVPTPDLRARFL
ncbi:MAG TPA: DCC1-like thiol-disulfide oxidoreductase family protein, partial [Labilithrix sp.]